MDINIIQSLLAVSCKHKEYVISDHGHSFLTQDLHDSTPLEFKCTSDAHLSGALTEMLTMTVEATLPKNLLVRGFTRILKFFESISPLNRFFHIISSGEQLISYAIPDGQYALIIGHMAVDEDKKLVLTGPVYVSKQKSFLVQCIKYIRK